jgi:hypothetical protein
VQPEIVSTTITHFAHSWFMKQFSDNCYILDGCALKEIAYAVHRVVLCSKATCCGGWRVAEGTRAPTGKPDQLQ